MRLTTTERLELALLTRGYQRNASRSRKYTCFTHSAEGTLWLGKAGALRIGPNVTKSHPVTDAFKQHLLDSVPPKL